VKFISLQIRLLALAALIALATVNAVGTAHAQTKSVVNVYSDGDTNITDWMANIVKPAFEKAYPQYTMNFVNARGAGEGTKSIADRALAALQTGADPQAEVLDFDALSYPELIKAGLWQQLDEQNVPNLKNVNPAGITSKNDMPYRGSQVLIAYDSAKVPEAEVPKTFADLIKWIKAHPGQFVYCRPDKGGSGGNFVVRAIYEVTGKDPTLFKAGEANPELLNQFDKAWDLLREIHPFIYDNGAYPAGNNPVLQLLANGTVSMASVWSDQSLQALSKGVLPDTIKLFQFTDLPMPGGYAHLSIPKNAKNLQGALDFVNFMLTSDMQVGVIKTIGGFPAVKWDTLPKELQTQFTSVITSNVPFWPGGAYGAARNKGWYEKVATNIKPDPTATPAPATAVATMAATAKP
jgi:putative spermidine/putrescine transport system substrate-binding protein